MLQAGPLLTQIGIDKGISESDWGVLLAVRDRGRSSASCLTIVASRFRVSLTGTFSSRMMFDLRVRVFAHLQRLSLDYYTDEKAGVIMTRMTSDVEALQQLLQEGLVQFAVQGLTMLVVTVILFFYNVELALITLLLIVPALTGALAVVPQRVRQGLQPGARRHRRRAQRPLREPVGRTRRRRVQPAAAQRAQPPQRGRRVPRRQRPHRRASPRRYGAGSELIGLLGQAALLGIGGTMVQRRHASRSASWPRSSSTSTRSSSRSSSWCSSTTCTSRVRPRSRSSTSCSPPCRSVQEADDAEPLPPIDGDIVLDGRLVRLRPRDARAPRRRPAHRARARRCRSSVPTGAGKSTIAKLVTRFYDPTEGRVAIDGHDLRDVTIESLRRQLGVVPQEPFLFAGTIRDNIAFARARRHRRRGRRGGPPGRAHRPRRPAPRGARHARCTNAACRSSSGERQLIALARAFLAEPRVLVLDEATSNLDLKSETPGGGGARRGPRGAHRDHRGPPPLDRDARRPHRRGRRRPHRRARARTRSSSTTGGRYAEMYAAWTAHLGPTHDEEPRPGTSGPGEAGPRPNGRGRSPIRGNHRPWPTRFRSSTTSCSGDDPHLEAQRVHRVRGDLLRPPQRLRPVRQDRRSARRRLGTTGVVRSFAIVHQAAPGVPVPYVSTVVDLDGGGEREGQRRQRRARARQGVARNEGAAHDVRRRYRRRRHRGRSLRLRAGLTAGRRSQSANDTRSVR